MGTFELHAVYASGRAAKPAARGLANFLQASLALVQIPAPERTGCDSR